MARNFMMSRPMAIIYGAILFLLVIWYSKPGVVTSKFVGSWALKGVTTPPSKVLGSLSPGSPASLGTAKQHRPTLRSALPAGDHGMPSGGQDPTLQPPAAPKPRGLTLTTFDGPFFVFAGLFLIAIGLGLRAVVGPRPRRPSVWEAKDAQALGPQWAMATAAPHAGGLSPWELHTRLSVATSTDRLDLADCGLQQLPPEVLQLKGLHELSLSGNHLTALPPGIGELRHLRKLCLAGNRLETVPEELGALAALEVLELHGNDLVALPESLGRLRALKQLCVSGNRLEALPESLGGLARLTHLTAGGNRLRALPASIGGLRALEFLHVHGNALTALPDAVGNLESVQEIYVQGNYLTSLPETMGRLRHMNEFSCADNRLSSVFADWSGLEALGLCYMYGNRLRELPPSMARMPALRTLWVEGNPLDPQRLLAVLREMPRARIIGVDEGQVGGVPAGALAACPNVAVGQVHSDGGAVQGYFKLQFFTPGQRAKVLVVVFGSAPGVPNWGKLLDRVAESMRAEDGVPFDSYFVADPLREWYRGGADARAQYPDRIAAVAAEYPRVVLMGDSMGATGALLCAPAATRVLAFCPQIDLRTASIRPRYDEGQFATLRRNVRGSLGQCTGAVDIHTGTWQHDEEQARLVQDIPCVRVAVHDYQSHRVALALNHHSLLQPLVRNAILSEARAAESLLAVG